MEGGPDGDRTHSSRALSRGFWAEVGASAVAGTLGLLTAFWHDWIEWIFGVDPDHHGGTLEWVIVGCFLALATTLSLLARREWQAASASVAGARD